jgi:hypothetical protein
MNSKIILVAFIITVLFMLIEYNSNVVGNDSENTVSAKSIEEVIKDHTIELMSIQNVVGIAQGLCNNKPCIKVFVDKRMPESEQTIPEIIEGFRVDIVQSGIFHTLPENHDSEK